MHQTASFYVFSVGKAQHHNSILACSIYCTNVFVPNECSTNINGTNSCFISFTHCTKWFTHRTEVSACIHTFER